VSVVSVASSSLTQQSRTYKQTAVCH